MKPVLDNFDVRTKLAMVACLSSTAVFIQHVYVLGFLLALSILLSALFYGRLTRTFNTTKRLWYILLAMIILQSIFARSGAILFEIGGFTILTAGGLMRGAEFLLRISVIIFSATIIASSTSREVVQGLVQLKVPYEIAFMVSVGIRFLPLLRNEFVEVLTAIQLRGVELRKIHFKKRLKLYAYILTPVIAGAIHKAHRLSMAMETRAFRAYPNRTSYLRLRLMKKDYAVIAIAFLSAVAVFISYFIFQFPGGII